MLRGIVILAGLVLPALVAAQVPGAGERLLAPVPAGYALGNSVQTRDGTVHEYIPAGESVGAWSQMQTVRDFPSLAGADPAAFHELMVESLVAACPDALYQEVAATVERGARVHLLLVGCPLSPATGGEEWFLSKTIGGQAALYNVQGAWRGPATQALVEGWAAHLRQVVLCDPARADMPCPAP